ncbi:oxidative stress-induced growth inhibitor 2-like [Tachypleus tridentatus]|uniref:oxidative stress-induced growth inhibitor 2-like n=1 Tax=Tachypleus tridentatus TaxID=6853 RepID=UPI003FD14158
MAVYKDVVVIGNGPSAITLSYLLAGNMPYYTAQSHPVDFLHYRLEGLHQSIVDMDLQWLSEGLEGRSNNPVSLLFDALSHPDADLGVEQPSVLSWYYQPSKKTDHVVLGKGPPGGAWQKMEGGTLTISFGSWMELPGLPFRDWNAMRYRDRTCIPGIRQNRASVGSVARYYKDYVDIMGLGDFFVNYATVTSVQQVGTDCDGEKLNPGVNQLYPLWEVQGEKVEQCQDTGEMKTVDFGYITPHVVLATGNSDQPNHLCVPGENQPFVIHSLLHLERLLLRGHLTPESGTLLIVGAGLSAADAVIAARFHGISVAHVFRRCVDDPELIFNKLPQNMYPEYHKVNQMMADQSNSYGGYKCYQAHRVTAIHSNHEVVLESINCGNKCIVHAVYVLVLIGMHPDLSFMPNSGNNIGVLSSKSVNCKTNPIDIHSFTHETVCHPGIFALGPLVGDNFVRFSQGGALAITSYLHKKRKIKLSLQ